CPAAAIVVDAGERVRLRAGDAVDGTLAGAGRSVAIRVAVAAVGDAMPPGPGSLRAGRVGPIAGARREGRAGDLEVVRGAVRDERWRNHGGVSAADVETTEAEVGTSRNRGRRG